MQYILIADDNEDIREALSICQDRICNTES